jgi:hypothetical protein
MRKTWTLSALAGSVLVSVFGVSTVQAQTRGLGVRAGWYTGNDFVAGGKKTHLEGVEIGVDIPIAKQTSSIAEVTLSPSIVLGGITRHGSDTDGNIYRVLLNTRRSYSQSIFYGAGLGYSGTQARASQFSNDSGFATTLFLGYELGSGVGVGTKPFFQITYHDGTSNKVRGFSFDIGARF